MATQAIVGQAYTPTAEVRDSNGSLVTSGVTGTLQQYGPTGALLTSGSVSYFGAGNWGYTVAGSFITVAGEYPWTATLTFGSTTLTASGAFRASISDNTWTLREVYTQLRVALDDGWTDTTTGNGSTSTLVCATFKYGSTNDWGGSELFLFEPGAVADTNPVRVIGFDPLTGTFTFAPTITATVAGQDFIVGNRDGQGWRHEQIILAIQRAVRKVGAGAALVDEDSLTYSTATAEYIAPATFGVVTGLAYQPPGANTGEWLPIADRYWDWQPERRRVVFTRQAGGVYRYGTYGTYGSGWRWGNGFAIPQSSKLRLMGKAVPQLPSLMGEALDADGLRVFDLALLDLLEQSTDPGNRQRAVMHAGQMGRPTVRMPR